MDSSYRQIIKRILKEEKMGDQTLTRLLSWYDTWNKKLGEYIIAEDFAKIIDSHFKSGLALFSSIKRVMKTSPETKEVLTEKLETLRSKLLTINKSRKSIESLK